MLYKRLSLIIVLLVFVNSSAYAISYNKINNTSKPKDYFTGRKEILKNIKETLISKHIVSIVGISGIGKTEGRRQVK